MPPEWTDKYCNQYNNAKVFGQVMSMQVMCGYPAVHWEGSESYCKDHKPDDTAPVAEHQANMNLHSTPVPAHRVDHTF